VFGRDLARQPIEIFLDLNKCVNDGHQEGIKPGQRAALPGFGSGHGQLL
jgi:hypothetical protein